MDWQQLRSEFLKLADRRLSVEVNIRNDCVQNAWIRGNHDRVDRETLETLAEAAGRLLVDAESTSGRWLYEGASNSVRWWIKAADRFGELTIWGTEEPSGDVVAVIKIADAAKASAAVALDESVAFQLATVLVAEDTARLPASDQNDGPIQALEKVLAATGDETSRAVLAKASSNKSADDRMRDILMLDSRLEAKSSADWALMLGCTDAAIRKTLTWKAIQRRRKAGGDSYKDWTEDDESA